MNGRMDERMTQRTNTNGRANTVECDEIRGVRGKRWMWGEKESELASGWIGVKSGVKCELINSNDRHHARECECVKSMCMW